MKFKKTFQLLFAATIISFNSFSQTAADGIAGGYIDAVGGRDKLTQINSVSIEGTAEVMGSEGPYNITILNGKGYKIEMNFSGSNVVQSVTADSGWLINPFMGMPAASAMEKGQYLSLRDNIFIPNPLLNYSTNGYLLKLTGQDAVDGQPAYKIETTSPDSVLTTYYIDSATHYIDERIININGELTTAKFSDYRKTDFGNTMAFTEDLTTPQGYELTFKIDKITINAPVDASAFDKPKN